MWHAKNGVSREEALRHWRHEHAELVRAVPGLRGYVQDHCTESPEGGDIPFTGLGEVWFDSLDSAATATKSPEWSAVISDAATFMDLETVVAAWADEHRIIAPN
jgi:uncharacterized protein (TIGR02118 family)